MVEQPNNEEIIRKITSYKQAARQWLNELNDLNAPIGTLRCILNIPEMLEAAFMNLSTQPELEELSEKISNTEERLDAIEERVEELEGIEN